MAKTGMNTENCILWGEGKNWRLGRNSACGQSGWRKRSINGVEIHGGGDENFSFPLGREPCEGEGSGIRNQDSGFRTSGKDRTRT